MKSLFWKTKAERSDTVMKDMAKHLHDLHARFARIEETLDRLAAQSPHIVIETVHIHQPVLEKMEYRLDNLDIELLSGSLNLGNNFGAKIRTDPSPAAAFKKEQPDLQRTPSGFRLKRTLGDGR